MQLKNGLSTPWRGRGSGASQGPAWPQSLPKAPGGGQVKLNPNKPFPFTLFHIWWGCPNHRSASSYLKGKVFLYYCFLNSPLSPFEELPISLGIYPYIRPESLCQRDVEGLPLLKFACLGNKTLSEGLLHLMISLKKKKKIARGKVNPSSRDLPGRGRR